MQTNNSKEKVRQLQNKLYLTAKKCDSRRFHALYIGMMYFLKHGNE